MNDNKASALVCQLDQWIKKKLTIVTSILTNSKSNPLPAQNQQNQLSPTKQQSI